MTIKNSQLLVWNFWCDDDYGNTYIWKYYSRDGRPTPWNVLHWLNMPAPTCTCKHMQPWVPIHTHIHRYISTTSCNTSSSITYTTAILLIQHGQLRRSFPVLYFIHESCCTKVPAVSHQFLPKGAKVQYQASPCGNFSGRSGIGTGPPPPPEYCGFPVSIIPPMLYTHLSITNVT